MNIFAQFDFNVSVKTYYLVESKKNHRLVHFNILTFFTISVQFCYFTMPQQKF